MKVTNSRTIATSKPGHLARHPHRPVRRCLTGRARIARQRGRRLDRGPRRMNEDDLASPRLDHDQSAVIVEPPAAGAHRPDANTHLAGDRAPRSARKPRVGLRIGWRAKLLQGCVTMAGPPKRGAGLW